MSNSDTEEVKVWDLSTRIFHWGLVIAIVSCWITIENRWIIAHQFSGLTVFFLIFWRIIWGVVGSKTSRFVEFIRWPWKAVTYLMRSFNQHKDYHTGHNPAGGWMVVFLIVLLVAQSITGMLANNDLGFSGPLSDLVTKDISDWATQLHGLIFNLVLVLVWFHLIAVFFYVLVKNQNLIKAMLTGRKSKEQTGDDVEGLFFVPAWRTILTYGVSLIVVVIIFVL